MATLAANVAHGWPRGPAGAVVAAWPAASLVGSYELLLWLIRTSAAVTHDQSPGKGGDPAGHPAAELRMVPVAVTGADGSRSAMGGSEAAGVLDRRCMAAGADLDQVSVPRRPGPDSAYQSVGQQTAGRSALEVPARTDDSEDHANLAAVAAYRASMKTGTPLSERKLAAMFGKTSRRRARNRMTEARTRSTAGTARSH